jgi:hypothetical protein
MLLPILPVSAKYSHAHVLLYKYYCCDLVPEFSGLAWLQSAGDSSIFYNNFWRLRLDSTIHLDLNVTSYFGVVNLY